MFLVGLVVSTFFVYTNCTYFSGGLGVSGVLATVVSYNYFSDYVNVFD